MEIISRYKYSLRMALRKGEQLYGFPKYLPKQLLFFWKLNIFFRKDVRICIYPISHILCVNIYINGESTFFTKTFFLI